MSKIVNIRYEAAGISDPALVTTLAPYQTTLESYFIDNVGSAANDFGRYDFSIPAGSSCAALTPYIPNGATVYLYNGSATVQTDGTNNYAPAVQCALPTLIGFAPGAVPTRGSTVYSVATPGQIAQLPGVWNTAAQGGTDTSPSVITLTCAQGTGGSISTVSDTNNSTQTLVGTLFWTY